ncbi:GDSL-type esterase/lipase family protein [Ulvibacterium sp.]|uniref:GDSL-type esterase/lipase family protein n=1 Tax=Ulvibacterium sp. TaxID=2665914 RepID=UPI002623153B|nr:GDSL-type esterase/lipase family protein [Ulvibacterium sp.]
MDRRQFLAHSSILLMGSSFLGCLSNNRPTLKSDQIIGCLGDSITYGNKEGYVELLQQYYAKNHPEMNLTFRNWGKSSETITGLTEEHHPGPRPYLFERLDTLMDSEPVDVITFCYGINCGIYGPPSQALFDSYKTGIYTFLEKIKQRNIRAILLTPPPLVLDVAPISPAAQETSYGYLNPYPDYDKEVLQEFKEIVLDFNHRAVMDIIDINTPLFKNRADCYDTDPIHPNAQGHRLIADMIIENFGI